MNEKEEARKNALEELSKLQKKNAAFINEINKLAALDNDFEVDMEYVAYSHNLVTEIGRLIEKKLNDLPPKYDKNRWIRHILMGILSAEALIIFMNSKNADNEKDLLLRHVNVTLEISLEVSREQKWRAENE